MGLRRRHTTGVGTTKVSAHPQPRGMLKTPNETIVVQVNPRIGDIVDSYLEHRNKEVESLRNSLARGEFERIRHAAHDLVGTGGSFGFEDMTVIGRSLESAAANKQTDEIKILVEELAEYLSRVEVVYEQA